MKPVRAATARSQLLYIGNDPLLSKASSALLRTAGFRVKSTNPLHVIEAARDCRYCAAILCATLSAEEMNAAVRAIELSQPDTPIICVQVGLLGDGPHPSSSVVVDAMQGPLAFIGAVKSVALLRQRAS